MFEWDLEASRVATRLAMPLGFGITCLLLGALGRRRFPRTGLGWVLIGATTLWLGSLSPVATALQGHLEAWAPNLPLEDIAPADTILVLGGATEPALPPREFADLGPAADRLAHAARLYHAERAPLVVLSGGNPASRHDRRSEAAIMADFLEAWGVPREAMILEEESANTHENCLRAKSLIEQSEIEEVLLVTSAVHMARAGAACATVGLAFRPAPTDHEAVERPIRGLADLLPDAEALVRTSRAAYEWIGIAVYWWRGWIDPAKLPPPTGGTSR